LIYRLVVYMETEFIVKKKQLRVISWNTQRMGYSSMTKLMQFKKLVERLKPDVIFLQETQN